MMNQRVVSFLMMLQILKIALYTQKLVKLIILLLNDGVRTVNYMPSIAPSQAFNYIRN